MTETKRDNHFTTQCSTSHVLEVKRDNQHPTRSELGHDPCAADTDSWPGSCDSKTDALRQRILARLEENDPAEYIQTHALIREFTNQTILSRSASRYAEAINMLQVLHEQRTDNERRIAARGLVFVAVVSALIGFFVAKA